MHSDSSHLQKPIHADVLLRIESTTSESSNTEKMDQSESIKNIDQSECPEMEKNNLLANEVESVAAVEAKVNNLELIEATEKMEISGSGKRHHESSSTPSLKSDDEGKPITTYYNSKNYYF